MILLILLAAGLSVILLSVFFFTPALDILDKWRVKREEVVASEMDNLFFETSPKQIMRLYFILPPALGIAGFLIMKSLIYILIGAVLGLFIPGMVLKIRNTNRRQKFNQQLIDAIMVISSALKGGLSILQALEVATEEIPAPMSQELGLVIRENKMGVTLEDALMHLSRRMSMEELNLLINSILVARETGGDLTKVLSRVTTSIRDNRKLKDSIATLTMQGRMQGLIMSALPFLFIAWTLSFNREHFDIMFHNETGRMLLFTMVALQLIGMILIRKFSRIEI